MRKFIVFLLLVGAIATFLTVSHQHFRVQDWLFWRYAGYWVATLVAGWSFLCFGHSLTAWATKTSHRFVEHLGIAFALGLFLFELLMFAASVGGQLTPSLFYLMPVLATAVGGRKTFTYVRRVMRHRSRVQTGAMKRVGRKGLIERLAMVGGILAFGLIYLAILSPENAQYDARWKHLRLAEEFVRNGGFRYFPEGWIFATRPHFTSFLYAWGFLVPGGHMFDRVELAAHLEFLIFAWTTLFQIPALVRRLMPRAPTRAIWAVRFLFPGVFLYDSSLSVGADHIGAVFAIPLLLLTWDLFNKLDIRRAALLGVVMAATAMVKYTVALMLLPPVILTLCFVATIQLLEARCRRQAMLEIGAATGVLLITGALFSSPHWLKNWIVYGNPLYPMLADVFDNAPWTSDAAYRLKHAYEGAFWRPERNASGLWETLKTLVTWSFSPNNWKAFHGDVPVIGSLFTLLLPVLAFLKNQRKTWMLVAWIHLSIFTWYGVHHQDRYIQSIMPWLSGALAAALLATWSIHSRLVRGALVALVSIQIIWGADLPFLARHGLSKSPLYTSAKLIAGAHDPPRNRLTIGQDTVEKLGTLFPSDSRVLVRDHRMLLGFPHQAVSDIPYFQFGLSYADAFSAIDLYKRWTRLGVTHLMWRPNSNRGNRSLAEDLAFFSFADRYTTDKRTLGPWQTGRAVIPSPSAEESDSKPKSVVILGCGTPYRTGRYPLPSLNRPPYGPDRHSFAIPPQLAKSTTHAVEMAQSSANFVLLDPRCKDRFPKGWRHGFRKLFTRKRFKNTPAYHGYIRIGDLSIVPESKTL